MLLSRAVSTGFLKRQAQSEGVADDRIPSRRSSEIRFKTLEVSDINTACFGQFLSG